MDDYESVPIEQFGMAMLRGMWWKGQGMGGIKNEVVRGEAQGSGSLRPRCEKYKENLNRGLGKTPTYVSWQL